MHYHGNRMSEFPKHSLFVNLFLENQFKQLCVSSLHFSQIIVIKLLNIAELVTYFVMILPICLCGTHRNQSLQAHIVPCEGMPLGTCRSGISLVN